MKTPLLSLLVVFMVFVSCKKQQPKSIDISSFPSITLIYPESDTVSKSEKDVQIKIKANSILGIKSLEFGLYRYPKNQDSIDLYHHWQPGNGTEAQYDGILKNKLQFNEAYKIFATAIDSQNNQSDSVFLFYWKYKDNKGPWVSPSYPWHGNKIYVVANSEAGVGVGLGDETGISSLYLEVKSLHGILGILEINDPSYFNKPDFYYGLGVKLGTHPSPGDTLPLTLHFHMQDVLGNKSNHLVENLYYLK